MSVRALGIVVKPATRPQVPRVVGVVMGGSRSAPRFIESFEISCVGDDRAEEILDFARQFEFWLRDRSITTAAVKVSAISAPAQRRQAATLRAHVEGAALLTLGHLNIARIACGDASILAQRTSTSRGQIQRIALEFPIQIRDAVYAAVAMLPAHDVDEAPLVGVRTEAGRVGAVGTA